MRRRRLIWHLFPSYLAIMAAMAIAFAVLGSRAVESHLSAEINEDLTARAHLIASQLAGQKVPLTPTQIQDSVVAAGRRSSTRITVILADGRVVADSDHTPATMANHSDRPEIQAAMAQGIGTSTRFSQTLGLNMMYVAVSMGLKLPPTAVVRTALPLTRIHSAVAALRWRIVLISISVGLLAMALNWWMARRIVGPIEAFQDGAHRFAKGDLTHRMAHPEPEELARLADTMNQMAAELDRRIQQLTGQRNMTDAILASMAEGVLAMDAEGRILTLNHTAATILGLPAQQLHHRNASEVIRNRGFQDQVHETAVSGESSEADLIFGSPDERIVFTRCTALRDATRTQIGTLVVMDDVTHLRRLENMRRDFAANVSHEIRTPLTAIKGFVETLRYTPVPNAEQADRFLAIVERHVHRLSAIIDDLMKLSRIEQTRSPADMIRAPLNVAELLARIATDFQPLADERQVAIQVDCPTHLRVPADASLLEQAVVNLLDNAIKYSRPETAVLLTADRRADRVVIAVTDTGEGIPRKHLPRLFERFYRVDKARSRQMGGTGLGLSIVKHIVQAHGGQVTVESAIGKGSTFSIELPAAEAPVGN